MVAILCDGLVFSHDSPVALESIGEYGRSSIPEFTQIWTDAEWRERIRQQTAGEPGSMYDIYCTDEYGAHQTWNIIDSVRWKYMIDNDGFL